MTPLAKDDEPGVKADVEYCIFRNLAEVVGEFVANTFAFNVPLVICDAV